MHILTTPTVTFKFPPGVNMSAANRVYVTFTDTKNNILVNKTGNDVRTTTDTVSVTLTQQETSNLPRKGVKVQVNWTYTDGGALKRACTDSMVIGIGENLYPQVIS